MFFPSFASAFVNTTSLKSERGTTAPELFLGASTIHSAELLLAFAIFLVTEKTSPVSVLVILNLNLSFFGRYLTSAVILSPGLTGNEGTKTAGLDKIHNIHNTLHYY